MRASSIQSQPGKVDVLVDSLDDVKEEGDAKRVLDEVKPSIVVWSAGTFMRACFPSFS